MERNIPERRDLAVEGPAGPPDTRVIASGTDWSVREYTCHAGPHDRPYEERHEGFTIAAVVEGSFTYRADGGRVLLHPGALLLGNDGRCFECGHDHSIGDRCIAFHFAPAFFAEISAAATGAGGYKFPTAMLPMANQWMPLIAGIEAMEQRTLPFKSEEAVFRLAETVVAAVSGHIVPQVRITPREERRIADVLRTIEDRATEPLDLDGLAAIAGMSKYHFLRVFGRTVGMTPHQFLLAVRMRRAALRLIQTLEPVSAIAFEAGFGDLSTFNRRFRGLFGMSPMAYQRRGGSA
jgi:AraC family transcriptional regulator